ncbi:MAG: ribosome biogenesis GTP-binding protein YihA/YsxC [Betaproteobacteria bacterium]
MKTFSDAAFIAAAGRPAEFPPARAPEVVFAGRSNVGKSSAINALLGRRRLAFTSKTPGRTQTINFYDSGEGWRIVDLPGYGFARVPKPLQAKWGELIAAYLGGARPIAALVVVMDARHAFTPLDRQLLGWLTMDAHTLILLSKADKLGRAHQAQTLRDARAMSPATVLLFSSDTRQGVEEARGLLHGWLQQAAEIKSPR